MPCLKIFTNLPKSKIPGNIVDAIIPVLATSVNKSPEKFICLVSGDCSIGIGGSSSAPGAVAILESIGNLGREENKRITANITQFVKDNMGIDPDRFLITFYDMAPQNVGKGGVTMV